MAKLVKRKLLEKLRAVALGYCRQKHCASRLERRHSALLYYAGRR